MVTQQRTSLFDRSGQLESTVGIYPLPRRRRLDQPLACALSAMRRLSLWSCR